MYPYMFLYLLRHIPPLWATAPYPFNYAISFIASYFFQPNVYNHKAMATMFGILWPPSLLIFRSFYAPEHFRSHEYLVKFLFLHGLSLSLSHSPKLGICSTHSTATNTLVSPAYIDFAQWLVFRQVIVERECIGFYVYLFRFLFFLLGFRLAYDDTPCPYIST